MAPAMATVLRRPPLLRLLFSSLLSRPLPFSSSPPPLLPSWSSLVYLQGSCLSTVSTAAAAVSSDFETDSDEPSGPVDELDLDGLLQLLSQAKYMSSSRKEALAFMRAASGVVPTRALACRALWRLRWDSELAFLAFRWAEGCVRDCPWAWHLAVWSMGKQGRFDMAWYLVKKMYKEGILTQRAMVIMMERYATRNEARKAIKTFHNMDKFKVDADFTAFYALLRSLCKNKYVEEAEEFLLLNKKFFPLSVESYNLVLDGWCNILCDVVESKRTWREMSNYCITPDGTSYSHMISCFAKSGNLFDSLRLYDEMKKRGWTPNITVYNSLIYVLTKESCLKDANNVFDKIIEDRLQPNVQTYNAMIQPLCELNKLEEARMVMDDMIIKGVNPTLETYHAFAKAEDIEGTVKLLRKMKDAGSGPNSHTFLLILDKFFRLGESEKALRIWSEMTKYGVIPSPSHYMALVQGLIKHEYIQKALEFYNEMKYKGFPADPKLDKFFANFLSNNKNHWGKGGKEYILPRHRKNNARPVSKIC